MADDIDTLAGTRRRAIAAKVLRDRYGTDIDLHQRIRAAADVLAALDEDNYDAELIGGGYTVEQEARADAIHALSRVAAGTGTGLRSMELVVDALLEHAETLAGYIRDGKVGE